MSTNEIKISINNIIDNVNDKVVLEAYYEILQKLIKVHESKVVGYDSDGEEISREGLEKNIDLARNRIQSGNSISNEDLKNDFKNW